MKKLSTEEFINRCDSIHDSRYDYSMTEYKGRKCMVKIGCKEHGGFTQMAGVHLRGFGCSACSKNKRLTTNEFIRRAINKHGNRYGYSKTKYDSSNKKVIVTCKIHGDFVQIANNHLNGASCGYCSHRYILMPDLLDRFNRKHNYTYNYSSIKYISMFKHVDIVCSHHGVFSQTPSNHLKGHGCAKCSKNVSNMERSWLDNIGVLESNRQVYLNLNGSKVFVDGLDPVSKTVYEFYGDFWHGNPKIYDANALNRVNKKTFGFLYSKTLRKESLLKKSGYRVISIWESDWVDFGRASNG